MHVPDPRYFDYAASAPLFRKALETFADISRQFSANPSSAHKPGKEAKRKLLECKKAFCDLLHFYDGRMLLCASGTEANNIIIEGHLKRFPQGRILIAEDTHDCIWYAVEKHSSSVDVLKINPNGQIDPGQLKGALTPAVSLVCLNHVSHELGTIHPLETIAGLCAARGVKLLVDGAQAAGHIPVKLDSVWCDYYSFSAHKFGGTRSLGGVLIRDQAFEPLLHGGKQEWGLRPGTEDLAGLAASLEALKISIQTAHEEAGRLDRLKDHFLGKIKRLIPRVLVNSPSSGLPGLISLSFPGFAGREIQAALSLSGYAVSTGSACHADEVEPSRIIMALGRTKQEAIGTIRISMGRGTTEAAAEGLLQAIVDYVK